MKHKIIKICLLLSIATLSFSGCKKAEPVNEVPESAPVQETVAEIPGEETTTEDPLEKVMDEKAVEEIPDNTISTAPNNSYIDHDKDDEAPAEYTTEIAEVLDTQMYVIKASNIRKLDNEKAAMIAPAETGAYLTVTGKTTNGWYEVAWGNGKGYLPADTLSPDNPNPQPAASDIVSDSGRPADEVLEQFWDLMDKGWDDGVGGPISQEALDNASSDWIERYNKIASTPW